MFIFWPGQDAAAARAVTWYYSTNAHQMFGYMILGEHMIAHTVWGIYEVSMRYIWGIYEVYEVYAVWFWNFPDSNHMIRRSNVIWIMSQLPFAIRDVSGWGINKIYKIACVILVEEKHGLSSYPLLDAPSNVAKPHPKKRHPATVVHPK